MGTTAALLCMLCRLVDATIPLTNVMASIIEPFSIYCHQQDLLKIKQAIWEEEAKAITLFP